MIESRRPEEPYPGLRPFEQHEASIFFGRETHIDQMLTRLEEQTDFRFLAVIGASGSGKSSLVRAGLLPAIADGGLLSAPSKWKQVVIRPGIAPMANLARGWVGAFTPLREDADEKVAEQERRRFQLDVDFVLAQFQGGPLGVTRAYRAQLPQADEGVLLLIDQFEELFRFHREAADERDQQRNEAAQFVELLLHTARQSEAPIYVVLTMRSDFLGDCDQFADLPEAISRSQFLTPRLTREQLAAAIRSPVTVDPFGDRVDDALVNRLLNDMGTDPDQLPLMQHALHRTWRIAVERAARAGTEDVVLGIGDYEAAGQFREALPIDAELTLKEIAADPVRGQSRARAAELLFRALSQRTEEGQVIRRPVIVAEVLGTLAEKPSELDREDLEAVIAAFQGSGRHFLMRSSPRASTGEMARQRLSAGTTSSAAADPWPGAQDTIDVSHECLLRRWGTLQEKWLPAEQDAASGYRRLLEEVRSKGSVLTGAGLQRAVAWRDTHRPTPAWAKRYDGAKSDDDSLLPRCLQLIAEGEQHAIARLAEDQKREQEALAAKEEAERQKQHAFLAVLVAVPALLLAFVAYRERDAAVTLSAKNVQLGVRGAELVAVDRLSRSLAQYNRDFNARDLQTSLKNPETDLRYLGVEYEIASAPYGPLFAPIEEIDAHVHSLVMAGAAADSRRFITLGTDSVTGPPMLKTWLVDGSGQVQHIGTLTVKGEAKVTCFAIAPDGSVAVGSSTGSTSSTTLGLWSGKEGQELQLLPESPGEVQDMAFCGGSRWLAMICRPARADSAASAPDRSLQLAFWGIEECALVAKYPLKGADTELLASPDGSRLLTFARGDISVWNTPSTGSQQALAETIPGEGIACAAFHPSGQWLALAESSGRLQLVQLAPGDKVGARTVHSFDNPFGQIGEAGLTFDPSGQTLLVQARIGAVAVMNVRALADNLGHHSLLGLGDHIGLIPAWSDQPSANIFALGMPRTSVIQVHPSGRLVRFHLPRQFPAGYQGQLANQDSMERLTRRVGLSADGAWAVFYREPLKPRPSPFKQVVAEPQEPAKTPTPAGSIAGEMEVWDLRTSQLRARLPLRPLSHGYDENLAYSQGKPMLTRSGDLVVRVNEELGIGHGVVYRNISNLFRVVPPQKEDLAPAGWREVPLPDDMGRPWSVAVSSPAREIAVRLDGNRILMHSLVEAGDRANRWIEPANSAMLRDIAYSPDGMYLFLLGSKEAPDGTSQSFLSGIPAKSQLTNRWEPRFTVQQELFDLAVGGRAGRYDVFATGIGSDGMRIQRWSGTGPDSLTMTDSFESAELPQPTQLVMVNAQPVIGKEGVFPRPSRLIGTQGNTLRVWNAVTGRDVVALPVHREDILDLSVAEDGNCLLSLGRDGQYQVWESLGPLDSQELEKVLANVEQVLAEHLRSREALQAVASGSWSPEEKEWAHRLLRHRFSREVADEVEAEDRQLWSFLSVPGLSKETYQWVRDRAGLLPAEPKYQLTRALATYRCADDKKQAETAFDQLRNDKLFTDDDGSPNAALLRTYGMIATLTGSPRELTPTSWTEWLTLDAASMRETRMAVDARIAAASAELQQVSNLGIEILETAFEPKSRRLSFTVRARCRSEAVFRRLELRVFLNDQQLARPESTRSEANELLREARFEADVPSGVESAVVRAELVAAAPMPADPTVVRESTVSSYVGEKPRQFLILAGADSLDANSYAAQLPKLAGPIADTVAMRSVLTRGADEVRETANVFKLNDAELTAGQLKRTWDEVAQQARKGDLVVFHFSGHGAVTQQRLALALYDRLVPWTEVLSWIPPDLQVVVVLDCPHAGAVGLDEATNQHPTLRVLAGCTADQVVFERNGRGVFTLQIVEGLAGEADRSGNRDGVVSLGELFAYVKQGAASNKGNQTPESYGKLPDETVLTKALPLKR